MSSLEQSDIPLTSAESRWIEHRARLRAWRSCALLLCLLAAGAGCSDDAGDTADPPPGAAPGAPGGAGGAGGGGAGNSSGAAGATAAGAGGGAGSAGSPSVEVMDSLLDSETPFCTDGSTESPCPSPGAPGYGQDGNYGWAPHFAITSDVVHDERTGLTWERKPSIEKMSLATATAYCDGLVLEGAGGFRLPSRLEIITTTDFGRAGAVVNAAFEGPDYLYWTTSLSPDKGKYWIIGLGDGGFGTKSEYVLVSARCVKGTPIGAPSFTVSSDGLTATESLTGLVWQRGTSETPLSWLDALAYCRNLTLAGVSGFRVPNAKELQLLMVDGVGPTSWYHDVFVPLPAGQVEQPPLLWSSTPVRSKPATVWGLLGDGGAGRPWTSSGGTEHVRCVR